MAKRQVAVPASIAALLLLFSAVAYPAYPGSPVPFLLFDLGFITMLALVLPRPHSYAYSFFALMLFLGFWSKLMLHLVSGANFVEPIGAFSGESVEWDRALATAAAMAIGVSVARAIHLALAARSQPRTPTIPAPIPSWYLSRRKTIQIASLLALVALSLLNFQAAFYQAGVNPRLVLPLHLNVPAGWLISTGFALWVATLVHWEFQKTPRSLKYTLLIPVAEGLTSSTFALSRLLYFLHTVPYFIAVGFEWAKARAALSRRTLAGIVTLWALCFVMSLVLVSWLRINIYYLAYEPALVSVPGQKRVIAEPIHGATLANQIAPTAIQISQLFVDRWVGLEGVMAVSSHPGLGFELFSAAIRENPKKEKGGTSIYQIISNSGYEASERFTFGTLPGIGAILFYSGSLAIVVAGTVLATLLMIATELCGKYLTGNPFLLSVAGMAMASTLCQTHFPYLTAVFFVELWIALAFIHMLQAEPWRRLRG